MGNNKKNYERPVSPNELLYIIGEKEKPPFSIRIVIEGKGQLSLPTLQQAAKVAGDANPGSRLILSKDKKGLKWKDSGKTPSVIKVPSDELKNTPLEEHRLLQKSFSPYTESTSIIYLIDGPNQKIIFQSFHGVMDAKGVLHWAQDIFRCLNKETPIGTNSKLTDYEFVTQKTPRVYRSPLTFNAPSPVGNLSTKNLDTHYKRLTIPDTGHSLVAKIAQVLGRESYKYSNSTATFMVPVDLRRHDLSIKTTANFSYPLFLTVENGSSWQSLQSKLLNLLTLNKELCVDKNEIKIKRIPLTILGFGVSLLNKYNNWRKKNLVSAIISNLGKVNLGNFSHTTFKAKSVYSIPIPISMVPITLIIVENPKHTEVLFSGPRAEKEKLEKMASAIEAELNHNKNLNRYFDQVRVNELNSRKLTYPKNKNIYELFLENSTKYPNKVALYESEQSFTYQELNQLINKMATGLLDKGIKKGDVIGIQSNRSIKTVAAIFSVLKVGGAYLPLDPSLPNDRVRFILEDSNTKFCLTSSSEQIDSLFIPIDAIIRRKGNSSCLNTVSSEDLCYIIYTSGSTGSPKGVEVQHRNIINYVTWAKNYYGPDSSFNFALFTSLSFDLTMTSLFLPLLSGGSIHLFSNNLDHIMIEQILENPLINFLKLTPTHLDLFTKVTNKKATQKNLIVGGEQLKLSLAKLGLNTFAKGSRLFNEYGPTEATIGCITHEFIPGKDYHSSALPIGTPAPNTRIYLLDKNLNDVEPGDVGELYIAGDGLAKGYRNKPELTKEKFVQDKNGQVLYHTGDLAFLRDDYLYEFKGRVDDQIKIRGHRVELEEIDKTIEKNTEVQRSITIAKDLSGRKRLYTYVIINKNFNLIELKYELNKALPQYMIPAEILVIDEVPVTINGKVDIKKLPIPKLDSSLNISDNTSEGTTEIESKIKKIWARVLKVPEGSISQDHNFFDLGGDSLTSIEMAALLDLEFKINIDLLSLVKKPTVVNLAKYIKEI